MNKKVFLILSLLVGEVKEIKKKNIHLKMADSLRYKGRKKYAQCKVRVCSDCNFIQCFSKYTSRLRALACVGPEIVSGPNLIPQNRN